MTDDEIIEQYKKEMEEKTKRIIVKQNYDFYLEHLGNNTPEALNILDKIKNGYNPTQRDVFVIMCDDIDKINQYTFFYDLKERTSKGKISEEDFDILISIMQINDPNIESLLKQGFIYKGILVKEYPKEETKRF